MYTCYYSWMLFDDTLFIYHWQKVLVIRDHIISLTNNITIVKVVIWILIHDHVMIRVIWILIHDCCHDTCHLNFDQWSLSWYNMWCLYYSFLWIVTSIVLSIYICSLIIRFLSTLWICQKQGRYIFVSFGPCILSLGIEKDSSLVRSISIKVVGWYLSMTTNFLRKKRYFNDT